MRTESPADKIDSDLEALMRVVASQAAKSMADEMRRNPVIAPQWLSLQGAAQWLGYSEQQLSEFVRTKRAPKSVLFSRNARRFKVSDCDMWAAAGGPSQFPTDGRAV